MLNEEALSEIGEPAAKKRGERPGSQKELSRRGSYET